MGHGGPEGGSACGRTSSGLKWGHEAARMETRFPHVPLAQVSKGSAPDADHFFCVGVCVAPPPRPPNLPARPCLLGKGPGTAAGGGVWHKAFVVGSVSLWLRLLASRP